MNLKKILCLFLLLTVVFALASCGLTKKFTVTFNSDGGSEVPSQIVKKGKTAVAPADPVKDGYTFLGWFNGDTKWNFSNSINEDTTLVARWEAIVVEHVHADNDNDGKCDDCFLDLRETYKITYLDGWKKLKLTPSSYTVLDTDLVLPTPPEKADYVFVGWYSDEALTNHVTSINVNAKADLTFYAKYDPIPYTITYNLDGGVNASSNPATYDITDLNLKLADPTKENALFRGWYLDNAFTQPITEISRANLGNITLYARWANPADQYTITYLDPEGNELATDKFFKSESDQPIKDLVDDFNYELNGYAFIAWVDAEDESISYNCIPAGTDKNITVKAYIKNTITHNILYYVDGVFYYKGVFQEVDGLDELLSPVKGGYSFDGWYSNSLCSGDKVTSIPADTTEDLKLYGKHIPMEYTITYTVDGETVDLGLGTYETSDIDIALPAIPAKEGYVILGWYTTEGKLMEENKIVAGQFGNLELEARYQKITYTITYYINGGINNPDNVTEYLHDEVPTLYDPLSKSGYKFAGWYDNATFSGLPVEDLSQYENQNVSLFAMWIPDIDGDSSTLTPEVPF